MGRMATRRSPGRVRVRWLGHDDSAVEADYAELPDVLHEAIDKWFASNQSPNAFVLPLVIERDHESLSDLDADADVRDDLARLACVHGYEQASVPTYRRL